MDLDTLHEYLLLFLNETKSIMKQFSNLINIIDYINIQNHLYGNKRIASPIILAIIITSETQNFICKSLASLIMNEKQWFMRMSIKYIHK